MTLSISRRSFLQAASATAGVLVIGIRSDASSDTVQTLAGWLRIDADGLPTLLVNATEMGQGAQLVVRGAGAARAPAGPLTRPLRIDIAGPAC